MLPAPKKETIVAAVQNGDIEEIRELLKQEHLKSSLDQAIRIAAENQRKDICRLLIQNEHYVKEAPHLTTVVYLLIGEKEKAEKMLGGDVIKIRNSATMAANLGLTQVLENLLEKINPVEYLETLVIQSTQNNRPETLRFLLNKGADPNYGEGSYLIQTCRDGHLECVKVLLEHPDIQIRHEDNLPLKLAGQYQHKEVVQLLVNHPKFLKEDLTKAVEAMAYSGDHEKIEEILKTNPEILRNHTDVIPLAAHHNHTETVKVLLKKGAPIKKGDIRPLLSAIEHKNPEMLKLLLETKQINPHHNNNKVLTTALEKALPELVKIIISDTNFEDHNPLHALEAYAIVEDIEGLENLLRTKQLEHGEKSKALNSACKTGNIEIAKTLIEAGALIQSVAFDSLTMAAGHGHNELVKTLLKLGADPSNNGNSAFRWASNQQKEECVVTLLQSMTQENIQSLSKESLQHKYLIDEEIQRRRTKKAQSFKKIEREIEI